jgi:collagenase-like PrtC family protease
MWNIGGAINHLSVFETVKKIHHINRYLISGVYDCFDILKWNGGRPFFTRYMHHQVFIARIKELNSLGISFYHTFTNTNITEEDLNDDWANYFLEQTYHSMNGVICNSPILVKYLRAKFPDYKILGSCTILENRLEMLKSLQDVYDILIIPPYLNKSWEILDKIDLTKVEILPSELCLKDCKVRRLHYDLINKWNYTHEVSDYSELMEFYLRNPNSCVVRKRKEKVKDNELFLSKKDIDIFRNKGVPLFKLQDRIYPSYTINNIVKFVIWYSDESVVDKSKLLNVIPMTREEINKILEQA